MGRFDPFAGLVLLVILFLLANNKAKRDAEEAHEKGWRDGWRDRSGYEGDRHKRGDGQ